MRIRLKPYAPSGQTAPQGVLARAASLIWRGIVIGLPILSGAITAEAQVKVHTIGGGRLTATGPDFGFIDGNKIGRASCRERV